MTFEFYGRAVCKAGMRSDLVVVPAPGLDDHPCFVARAEPFQTEAFIAQFPVEALVGAVLPRLARIDQRRLDVRFNDPGQDRLADELRAIVRPHVTGSPALADQSGQDLDDALGSDAAGHVDGQALPGELIDHGQALDLLAIGAGVEDEVVGPDAVRAARRQRSWA